MDFLWKEYDSCSREKVFWIDRLEFWWDKNPFFNEKSKMGWVIYDKSICGIICNIPSVQTFNNSITVFDNLSCWYVKKKYRNQSLKLFNHAINNLDNTIIDNTPSENVEKILKLFKFKSLKKEQTKVFFIIQLLSLYKNEKLKFFLPKLFFDLINIFFKKFNKIFNPIRSKFVVGNFKIDDVYLKKTFNWLSLSNAFRYKFLEFEFGDKYSYAIFQERKRKNIKFHQLIDFYGYCPNKNNFLIFLKLIEKSLELKSDMIVLTNENNFFSNKFFLITSKFFRNNQYYLNKDPDFKFKNFHFLIGDKFI